MVTGYDAKQFEDIAGNTLSAEELQRHSASNLDSGIYQMVHSLSHSEAATPNSNA